MCLYGGIERKSRIRGAIMQDQNLPEPLSRLTQHCTDWSIHNRDYPRHGFQYEVHAIWFFVGARAVGRTLDEAIDRALKVLKTRRDKFQSANQADLPFED